MPDNGWSEYQKLVLAELKRLDESVHGCQRELAEIRLGLAVLRTRAVSWGAVGGDGHLADHRNSRPNF